MLLAFNKLCSGQFYPPTEASGCRPNAPLTSMARFGEDEQGWMMNQDMAGSRAERRYEVRPVAWVESPLTDRAQAPRQGFLGAPPAWLVVEPDVADGIRDLRPGDQVIVLTWLDRARRDELATVPGDNPASPPLGVFSTRSPNRPNPIGLHRTQVLAVEGLRIQVSELEALDGTPVIDIKPVIDRMAER